LICNYVTRIIEPLASRCAKFRFQALPPDSMKERLLGIAHAEGMMMTENGDDDVGKKSSPHSSPSSLNEGQLDAILLVAGGDMRRAVTSLQSVHALLSGSGVGEGTVGDNSMVVDETVIAELAGSPPPSAIEDLYRSLRSNRFDDVERAVRDGIMAGGYPVQAVLKMLLDRFTDCPGEELDELGRARLAIRIAEAEYKMNEGADEYLQLMTVCGLALQCLHEAGSRMKQ
jgi:replication factor C subunit 2/4